jgi:hypothetical protein
MDTAQSNTYANARGYTDWTDATSQQQLQALNRAADYILAHYKLKAELTPVDVERYDAAQFLIAYDILKSGGPATKAERPVIKESKELDGIKKSVEWGNAPSDPYPQATALLEPLRVSQTASGMWFGKLKR